MTAIDWRYATLDDAVRALDEREPANLPLSGWEDQKRRIFQSVFQTDAALQPTPTATPVIGTTEAGQPFGLPTIVTPSQQQDSLGSDDLVLPDAGSRAADDQIRFDRAWHTVTARIALPAGVAAEDSFGTLASPSQVSPSQATQAGGEAAFDAALPLVLHAGRLLPRAIHTEDVLAWHTQQVHRHYAHHVLPMLSACAGDGQDGQDDHHDYRYHRTVVQNSVRTLAAAFRLYFYGLLMLARGLPATEQADTVSADDLPADEVVSRFRQDVHALVANSAPAGLMASIRIIMAHSTGVLLLGTAASRDDGHGGTTVPQPPTETDADAQALRQHMHEMLASLHDVGLAGQSFQILFAEIMDRAMTDFVHESFAGRWADEGAAAALTTETPGRRLRPSRVAVASPNVTVLYGWVENHFGRLAHEVLGQIGGGGGGGEAVLFTDVTQWKEVALGRLSALRMAELFDIVLQWPDSEGGLRDLRVSVTTPARRSQLVAVFTGALRRRLLQPACSTLEILQTYIAMIRTFHALDRSNVLLSAVVGQLQLYLCQREDAVRIVVDGLLAEPGEDDAHKLVALAAILNDPQERRQHVDDEALDWTDMTWVPDPIDAGTHYRRPKTEDVIGTLINALGSREAFTKEFQSILAARLLSAQTDFAREGQVLALLRKRFGEASVQNCEVMMRDIGDSRRMGTLYGSRSSTRGYSAKILSRLYWPGLEQEPFRLPPPVAALQHTYAASYEASRKSRKLAWLDQLGQARVELVLADRTVAVQCRTYEAAVIYAFQEGGGAGEEKNDEDDGRADGADRDIPPVRRTVAELVAMLQADDEMVEQALVYWQKQGVLRAEGDAFVVVERLVEAEEHEAGSALTTTAPTGGTVPQPAKQARADEAQRTVYWQFIVGMLTNSAASMPQAQIAMMMRMLMAEGFPWTDEELLEFLGEKVVGGALEVTGGKYRLVKK